MAGKSISVTVPLAIGASNVDVLEGKRFKFPDRTGLLKVIGVGNLVDVEFQLFVGGDNPIETSPLPISTGPPLDPDHIVGMDIEVFAGQVIQALATNTNIAANEARLRFILDDNVEFIQ